MDELTTLTRLRAGVGMSPAVLDPGRTQLAAAMTRAAGGKKPRYARRVGWIGGSVVATGALAAVLVFTPLVGGASPDVANAAEVVLQDASINTIKTSDPTLADGQFLRVNERYTVADGDVAADGQSLAWIESGTIDVYVPKDRSAEWTQVQTPTGIVKAYGAAAKSAAEKQLDAQRAEHPNGVVYRAKGGEYWPGQEVPWSPARLAALPREPEALLREVHASAYGKSDDAAFDYLVQLLSSGMAPADLRASIYRSIALLPGVEVTAKSTTLGGQTGVAIGRVKSGGDERTDLIINEATGNLIGHQLVKLNTRTKGGPAVPAGTVIESSATTTSIVDKAPDMPAQNPGAPG